MQKSIKPFSIQNYFYSNAKNIDKKKQTNTGRNFDLATDSWTEKY